ncbi:hypothetical protein HDU92_007353 [Lobulomyces angularis]|nr:hypothetical protein HDU92_007353 [Lobulomyces angularis]
MINTLFPSGELFQDDDNFIIGSDLWKHLEASATEDINEQLKKKKNISFETLCTATLLQTENKNFNNNIEGKLVKKNLNSMVFNYSNLLFTQSIQEENNIKINKTIIDKFNFFDLSESEKVQNNTGFQFGNLNSKKNSTNFALEANNNFTRNSTSVWKEVPENVKEPRIFEELNATTTNKNQVKSFPEFKKNQQFENFKLSKSDKKSSVETRSGFEQETQVGLSTRTNPQHQPLHHQQFPLSQSMLLTTSFFNEIDSTFENLVVSNKNIFGVSKVTDSSNEKPYSSNGKFNTANEITTENRYIVKDNNESIAEKSYTTPNRGRCRYFFSGSCKQQSKCRFGHS